MAWLERPRDDLVVGARGALPRVEREAISLRTSIVALQGDHDVRTQQAVLDELSRTTYVPHLIIDLTSCTFIDSTIIATLLHCRRFGSRQVELVVPEEGEVNRTLSRAGVDILACVHRTLEEALRSEPSVPWRSPAR